MREIPVPSLRKLFALRQFSILGDVDLSDLALIAENVREVRHPKASDIAPVDVCPLAIDMVVAGSIESGARQWGPREVFGLLEVLANRPLTSPAIATEPTQTLQLAAADLLEILEDNFGVLSAVNRSLIASWVALDAGRELSIVAPSPLRLTLVERLMVLRQLAPFAGARLQALAALAQGCEEVALGAGATLARGGQHIESFVIPLAGTLHSHRSDREDPQPLLVSGAVGLWEALAALRHRHDIVAATPVRVLRCPTAVLIDVLEDHSDLGLAIAGNVAAALLDSKPVMERDQHHRWS